MIVQLRAKKTTRKFQIKPEDRTTINILEYCKLTCPKLYESVIKIHNEGNRSRSTNILLPRLGFRRGASDLFFAYPTARHPGLFMEIKKDGWKYTRAQKEHIERQQAFIDQMNANGYLADWAIGTDAGIALLNKYMWV